MKKGSIFPNQIPLALKRLRVIGLFFLFFLGNILQAQERPLMRFPDIHKDTVVFVHGEDIWKAPAKGGVATRLTIHDGEERFPKFSPDGNRIAFTGEHDGNSDVYVMDVYGGGITRVTYHPGYDEVVGWHPVKNKILFRSSRHSYSRFNRLYLISPQGTDIEELILHEAAQGSFSPEGTQIGYNKVAREHRTWKRYTGGLAQDIYIYDFYRDDHRQVTEFRGTDRIPMWIGDQIYFSSDRDGILNLYRYDTTKENITQLTEHKKYDIRRPSAGTDKIVYEIDGSVWSLDLETGEYAEIPIQIRSDAPAARAYLNNVKKFITGIDCSPSGNRAVVIARGEVFTVPKEEGPIRNLTQDSGSRDRDVAWSSDGKRIAYLSDKTGEYEIYLTDPKGREEHLRLTRHHKGYRHTLQWSPDGKKIAFADQTLRCYILDVKSKEITDVDKAHFENVDVPLKEKPISDFAWSPDSRYLAYSKMNEDLVYQVYIYSLEAGETHCVSSGLFNDFGPEFSKDGEHLFFISNRHFNPTFGDMEWEMVYKRVAGIYALTLRKNGPSFLPFLIDEAETGEEKKKKQSKNIPLKIDFRGIDSRIEALPLPRGNYRQLMANESSLFYLNAPRGDFNHFHFRDLPPRTLYAFSFDERKETIVIKDIDGYKLSAEGSHVVYKKEDQVGIIKSTAKDSKGHSLDLSGLEMWIDPVEEWKQIFNEAWRMERDFYYEPNMHGIDWEAMKEKYGRLIPHASCRQDVRYIIGEMIGELSTSHTYVFGGDQRREAKRVNVGMLGVDWMEDEDTQRYRIKKIYEVPDWSRAIIPPLQKPGVDIREGDYLLEADGKKVTTDCNVYSYFQNCAGKQVTLMVNNQPISEGAKEVVVKPLSSEGTLRYLSWVEENRKKVDEASEGQIGYIHLPDTYMGSAREFPKYFYSQTRKKGLIIDGRYNGGGLDPDVFLQRLDKKVLAYWTRRYSHDQTIPEMATRAHMVCLTNRQAGSGGDMLPMEFRMREMGPVIGTRTWGGLVGVSMWINLVDGGGLSAPDYRIYNRQGDWIVENEGIEPDIKVDLHPKEMARGYDAQLMRGIEILKKKIQENPRPWPEHKPFPKQERIKK